MKRTLATLAIFSLAAATPGIPADEKAEESKVDDSVKETLQTAGVPCTNDAEGNFHVRLKFKNGRAQKLVIISGRLVLGTEEHGDEMREIYSVATTSNEPPSGELCAKLLMESGSAKLGGWVVRKNGAKFETVYRAFVPAEICDEELLPAMALVATQADSLEKNQTDKDEN